MTESPTSVQAPNPLGSVQPDESGKRGIWKPFFKLLIQAKLPYFWIILSTVVGLASAQLSLLFPQYAQKITAGDISRPIIVGSILVVLGQAIFTAVRQFLANVASAKVTLSFRKLILKALIVLPIPYFDKSNAKDMISRTTDDTTKLSDLLAYGIGNILSSVYGIVGAFLILFSYDWRLAAAEVGILLVSIGIGILNGRINFKYNVKIQAKLAKLTGFISEILVNIPLVKSFVNEKKEEKRGKGYIKELFKVNFIFHIFGHLFGLFNNLVRVLQTIIIILLGIYLISRELITIDIWIAFYLYAEGLLTSVSILMGNWVLVKRGQGAVRRITEITLEPMEEYNRALSFEPKDEDISFKNVSFRYAEKEIIKNMNFTIPHGKITAIVGPSGAGKSTIFNLLMRFYEPNSGEIQFGGSAINNYKLQEWRKAFGHVAQDTQLFSGTIRDNIMYGVDRTVSMQEIEKAASAGCALDFIQSSEQGFDTPVGENGSKLSGGQRRRIAIARVILKNPPFLLFDEVTSSLDAESEFIVDQSLKELAVGRTTVIIAHRLATVKDADQILVLEDGEINGIGSHEELLENNKLYKKLVELQFDA